MASPPKTPASTARTSTNSTPAFRPSRPNSSPSAPFRLSSSSRLLWPPGVSPRVERSFYRALHELQRLQKEMAKQSQIAPEPQPQQDFTPPSSPSLVP